MIRRPPRSTLFPYTRSSDLGCPVQTVPARHKPCTFDLQRLHLPLLYPSRLIGCLFLDRKSTRLNSSHLVISYAVFCLKKKKNLMLAVHIFIHFLLDLSTYHA